MQLMFGHLNFPLNLMVFVIRSFEVYVLECWTDIAHLHTDNFKWPFRHYSFYAPLGVGGKKNKIRLKKYRA